MCTGARASRLAAVPGLKEFMLRREVLGYVDILILPILRTKLAPPGNKIACSVLYCAAQVLGLYREAHRATKGIDPQHRKDLL